MLIYLAVVGIIAGLFFGVKWVNVQADKRIQQDIGRPVADVPPRLVGTQMQVMDNVDPNQVIAEVESEVQTPDDKNNMTEFTKVKKGVFYDQGKMQATLTADRGTYNWNFQRLEFDGHVVVKTSENSTVKTEQVFWAKNMRILYCPRATTIVDDKGGVYRADGALYFPDSKFTVLFRNVHIRRGGKQPVTLTGEYVGYRENFESADIYGAQWAPMMFAQHQYTIAQFLPYTVPEFTIENAKVATRDSSIAAVQLHIDTEAKKVSAMGSRGVATFPGKGTLSSATMDFYWELGYLFAKYQVQIEKGTMSATTDEATYVQKDNSLRLSGSVKIQDTKPQWFYTGDQAPPGNLNADVIDYRLKTGDLTADGNVHIQQGQSWADASKLVFHAETRESVMENAHATTEKAEIFGRSLRVKGDAGRGAGDLKMTMFKANTSISAREGLWQNENDYLFKGDVTGTKDKFSFSGDTVGKKDGIITIAGVPEGAGAAHATEEGLTVTATTLKIKDSLITLDEGAHIEKKEFALTADQAEIDTDQKKGQASGHSVIVLTEGKLPESLGATSGKTAVQGDPIHFTWEPDHVTVEGDSFIRQGKLMITGEDFSWAKDGGGKLTGVVVDSPQSYLGEDQPSQIHGDAMAFTDDGVTIDGHTRLEEGNSRLTADKIVYAQDGSMTATGNLEFIKKGRDDKGEPVEAKLTCQSLSGDPDGVKISFAGPVSLSARNFKVTGDSGYFLTLDRVLIIEHNVGVDTELEAGSTHLDMDQFQYDMKTDTPRFRGVKGEVPIHPK